MPRIVTSTSIGAAQNGRMCNKARMMQARNFRRDPDPAQTVGRVRSLQVACSASGMTPGRGSKKVRGLGSWFPCRPIQAETARPPFPALDTSSLCSPHADMMPPTMATSERCLSAVEVGRRSGPAVKQFQRVVSADAHEAPGIARRADRLCHVLRRHASS
jgi:hypothetical protein